VIQASHRVGEYKFYFLKEENVYFNVKDEGSVIQASLKREGSLIYSFNNCVFLFIKIVFVSFSSPYIMGENKMSIKEV